DVLSPGTKPLIVETPWGKLGVLICYDLRFNAIFEYFEREGVEFIAIPGAFSKTTGEAHWKTLLRARAIDYQSWVMAACPAPNLSSTYVAWGHSLIADPWGRVVVEAGEKEEWISASLRADELERVRTQLPVIKHRQTEIYLDW
ncbi:carbon-nitrogen hydrolase family protein, partial [Myxococcota bacterium]|nr:carbon-nitrogen hydrolase family protein [Myxococcota bacterium]